MLDLEVVRHLKNIIKFVAMVFLTEILNQI